MRASTSPMVRVALALRRQDWAGVVVEILIVILGVFLGIQAANWNDARHERAEERRLYRQIAIDLGRDVERLQMAQVRSRHNDRAAELLLDALDGKADVRRDPSAFAKMVHYAGFLYLPTPSRRTYDELVSTGHLALLRDEGIKDGLASYYEQFADLKQWDGLLRDQQAQYWSASAGVVPRRVLQAALTESDPGVSPLEAEQMLREARARPALHNMLIGMAAHQARVRRDSNALEREARQLIAEIARRD